jgi:hypothetical protein
MAGLKVKSIKPCFYHGHLYQPGQVFVLPEGVKPSRDMEIVTGKTAEPAKAQVDEPQTFSELNAATVKAEGQAMKGKETVPKGK